MLELRFVIASGILQVRGTTCLSIRASSGRGECTNRPDCADRRSEGPLPVGGYSLDPSQLSDPGVFMDIARNLRGDWGDWRVPLVPAAETVVHGRSGFFLHGGTFRGSAGCIDVGGGVFGNALTDRLARVIMAQGGRVPVHVST